MATDKRLRCEHQSMRMEVMEPRMLLSADLLALAGLPGVDNSDDEAPWESIASKPTDLLGESSGSDNDSPSPLALSIFNGTYLQDDVPNGENDNLLALLSDNEQTKTASHLLFVDTRVEAYTELVSQIRQTNPQLEFHIYLVDADRNGITQISDALMQHTEVDAVHIISHGNANGLQLGNSWLNGGNISGYAEQLGRWSESLSADADLLFYGCDLAADSEGRSLIDSIGNLTGTDVAASIDLTGHESKGGDWELEYRIGSIEAAATSVVAPVGWEHTLVTNTIFDQFNAVAFSGDDGSLPWASDWIEVGESNGAFSGQVWVNTNANVSEQGLFFGQREIWREADLSSGYSAILSFDYALVNFEGAESASLLISTDQGGSWTQLDTITGIGTDTSLTSVSYNISSHIDSDTRIKFSGNAFDNGNDYLFVDNLLITLSDNLSPTFTSFGGTVDNTNEDTEVEISFADLVASGDEADADGTVDAFVVKSVSSGTLKIGTNAGTATTWAAGSNDTLDATNQAYWTPATNANGTIDAFAVVARDNLGIESVSSITAQVVVNAQNDAPALDNNGINVTQGQTIVLDSSMLSATDVDNTDNTITFNISNVSNGWFALAADTFTAITSFTQQQINNSEVVFVHDGGELAPAYDVTVTDSQPLSDGPTAATISFSNTNEGVLWLSTAGDEGGSNGVPGLNSSGWEQGDILQQANPNLSFGEADTNGSFSIAFDASNFASDAHINGIHFVASNVTVGGVNPIVLQAGDLLLTNDNDKTFTSNGASPAADMDVKKEDIFYFRPDIAGDYSTGNFYMLLTDPFGNDKEIQSISLVEKDVWLGDHWLYEGDLLLSGNFGSNENDIWVMRTDTLDTQSEATYQSTAQVLIEGDDAGVDLDHKIYGLDVLETTTSIGGKTYNAGTILVATDGDDSDGIGSTNQLADAQDVIALAVNKTSLGSGAGFAQVSASLMFDGHDISDNDVNFDSGTEEIDGLTLTSAPTSANATPTLGNNALGPIEGQIVTVTSAMLSATDADNADSGLIFNISDISGGQFELSGDPGNAVASFTQQQISDSEVVFVDNGDESAPGFNVSVSDGSAATAPVAGVVNFINVNDEPILTSTGSNLTFTEGGSAVSLFSATSVSTVESGQTLSGLTLTITNVNDGSNERLNADGTAIVLTNGTSGTTASNSLSYSVSVSGTTATVTLSGGTLSAAATQTLVDALSYQNNSSDPNTSGRVVTLTQLVDSGGTANSGDDTAALSVSSNVSVNTVNDAPTFSLFNDALGTTDEDTEVEITLTAMKVVGDEADLDGSVDGFVVKSISSGSLRIGTDAASATAWNAATNATIDATNRGYWTAAVHANGILDAFVAAAVDNTGVESSGSATGQVIVNAVNDAPAGLPTISGAATEHVMLRADTSTISDADGLGTFSFQWLRDNVVVGGATGTTYDLDDGDVGGRMSVRISYVDGGGSSETLTSAQTAVVSAVNDAPVVLRNQLTLSAGDSIVLSSAMLAATDADHADSGLTFAITSVSGGQFELISDPGVAITSFTQAQVTAGQVRFVDDGDNSAPDYTVQVSDSLVNIVSRPTINFVQNFSVTTMTAGGADTKPTTIPSIELEVVAAEPETDSEDEVDDSEASESADAAEEATSGVEEALVGPVANDELDAPVAVTGSQPESATETGSGLQTIFNDNALRNPFVNLLLGALAADIPAVPKLLASEIHTVLTTSGFLADLDRIRDTTSEANNLEQQRVASSIAVSTGLSIGYVAWLIRSGVLLSTVLSSLPAWHFVDPLPVLGTTIAARAKEVEQDDEDDSVESMFKDQAPAADKTESRSNSRTDIGGKSSEMSEHGR